MGKSFVASLLVDFLRSVFEYNFNEKVALTASTGIAAAHVGGTSLHSASGVGVPKFHGDFFKVRSSRTSKTFWANVEVLFEGEERPEPSQGATAGDEQGGACRGVHVAAAALDRASQDPAALPLLLSMQ